MSHTKEVYKSCPGCGSKEFYLVIDRNWSFKIKDIGTSGVTPGPLTDQVTGKGLVCDDCGWETSGEKWLEKYFMAKYGIPILPEEKGKI